jgi:hypothetical protein
VAEVEVTALITILRGADGGAGGDTNVNMSAATDVDVPADVVTNMSWAPAASGGDTAVSVVVDTIEKLVAAVEPKATLVVPPNPTPVMVTVVFPVVVPEVGEMDVTTGGFLTNVKMSPVTDFEVPADVVTKMSHVPAASAGETAVSVVVDMMVNLVAATEPNKTLVVWPNPEPVMVTVVFPAVVPDVGEMDVTTGGLLTNVNMSPVTDVEVPADVVTKMSYVPAASAGETAVSLVDDTTVNLVAATEPKRTLVVPSKALPLIVTVVPPVVEPEVGVMDVITGAGGFFAASAGEATSTDKPMAQAIAPIGVEPRMPRFRRRLIF